MVYNSSSPLLLQFSLYKWYCPVGTQICKCVFNDITKRLVLTGFLYIFPMWGQLFQPISFSDIWKGSDKLYTAFHRSKGIVFPFTPAANNKVRHMLSPSHRKLWACLCSTKYKYRKSVRLAKSWWSSAKVVYS